MAKTGFIFGVVHVSRDKKDLLFRRQESGNHETCMYRYISTFQTKTNQTHIHVYSPFLHLFFKIITKLMFRIENSNGNLWLFPLHMKFTVYQLRKRLSYLDKQSVSAILRFIQNVFQNSWTFVSHGELVYTCKYM